MTMQPPDAVARVHLTSTGARALLDAHVHAVRLHTAVLDATGAR